MKQVFSILVILSIHGVWILFDRTNEHIENLQCFWLYRTVLVSQQDENLRKVGFNIFAKGFERFGFLQNQREQTQTLFFFQFSK